jgi:molecular chaperone GrpE (heat shock protein)
MAIFDLDRTGSKGEAKRLKKSSKKGKKHRKYGRNRAKCEVYRREGRREHNKARRAAARARWLEKRQALL